MVDGYKGGEYGVDLGEGLEPRNVADMHYWGSQTRCRGLWLIMMMLGRGSWILMEIRHSHSLYLFTHSNCGLREGEMLV